MPDLIHIYHNNQQEGPYSLDQIRDMIAKGMVTPITLAWKQGMSDWSPLNTIISLPKTTPAAMPPPPPSQKPQQPSEASASVRAKRPRLIGGWLLFFCVDLTILTPLISSSQISEGWQEAQPLFGRFPSLQNVIFWEKIGLFGLLIYGFLVGCDIWRGNPNGRNVAKRYLLIYLFGVIGIEFLALMIMGYNIPSQFVGIAASVAIRKMFGAGIWFMIWWLYFKKSKRVRNTYGAM